MHIRFLNYSQRIFISVMVLLIAITVFFVGYQYHRERNYKADLLNMQLQSYIINMAETMEVSFSDSLCDAYVKKHPLNELRITVIRKDGTVIYDSEINDVSSMSNHRDRTEVKQALATGTGSVIQRKSASIGMEFFYSATYFKKRGLVYRAALPYDISLSKTLQADMAYIWVAICASVILTIIFYRLTRRVGINLAKLAQFASKAEHNEPIESFQNEQFPDDELGDISAHIIKLYMHLKESQEDKARLKKQLTQNIAHELKTPVCSIQGYLETLVQNKNIDSETQKHFIERCYAQTERLAHLVADISVLNKMEDVQQVKEPVLINIFEMVKGIASDVDLALKEKSMVLNNLLAPNVQMTGDQSLVYSIFRNFIDNSIAYAGENVTITIMCQPPANDGLLHFTYYDNGVGVGEEHLTRIFERFYRVDKGRSRKMGGTGLGLAIVRNAIVLHGGTVKAYLQTGGGLAFDFTLRQENTNVDNKA